MGIEAGFYSRLTASTSITALVGTRVFPGRVPQGQSFPNIRFSVMSQERQQKLTGHLSIYSAAVQVDCYTMNSYSGLITLSELVRTTLNTGSTVFGSISITNCHVQSELDEPPFTPIDGSDEWIYGRSLSCQLHFYST